jgi:hypothetical protein
LVAEHTARNVPARRLLAALGGGDVESRRLEVRASPAQLRAFRFWDQDGLLAQGMNNAD